MIICWQLPDSSGGGRRGGGVYRALLGPGHRTYESTKMLAWAPWPASRKPLGGDQRPTGQRFAPHPLDPFGDPRSLTALHSYRRWPGYWYK